MTNARKSKIYAVLFILGLSGTLLVLLNTSVYGAGATSDSVNYIAAARSLAAGRGLLCSDLEPFTAWPPLYPALLALIDLVTGIDPLQSVRWVNAVCFGAVILLCGIWVFIRTESGWAAVAGSLSVFLSFPLIPLSRMAWSEPLFILFTMVFLMAMEGFMRRGNFRSLSMAAALAGAAFLTRYTGIAAVFCGLVLILVHRQMNARGKARAAFFFMSVSVIPMVFWMARNFTVAGTFSGHQYPLSPTPWYNLLQTAAAVSKWFLPVEVPGSARFLLSGAVISAPAIVLLYRMFREPDSERPVFFETFLPLALFLVIYTCLLISTRNRLAFTLIGHRYLSPLYAPLAVYFIIFGFRAAALLERHRPGLRARFFFLLFFCAWLLHPGLRTVALSLKWHEEGAGGYASPRWQNSETARYLRERPPNGPVFSNDPQAAYLLASVPARRSAYKHPYNVPSGESNLSRFLQASEGGFLAWFDYPAKRFFTVSELEEFIDIETIAILSDGGVYRLVKSKER
jgi:hypothetical protein